MIDSGTRPPRMPGRGILYGTAWKQDETARLVAQAIECGFRGIDTACQPRHYNEPGVGAGIVRTLRAGVARREDLYVQSKFTPVAGQDPARTPYDPAAPIGQQVAQSCAVSLRNLQTQAVDCLLLHSPLATQSATLEAWRGMELLVEAGSVRSLGISNCYRLADLESLCRDARIAPGVVQNRLDAASGYGREIRGFCRERGIVYQGFWTLTANARLLGHPAITRPASSLRRTPAQVLFRYFTQRGVEPLTGTRSIGHMREDLAIFEFALTEDQLAAVDSIL